MSSEGKSWLVGFDQRVPVPRFVLLSQGVLIVGISVGAFMLGAFYGRNAPRELQSEGPFTISGTVQYVADGRVQNDGDSVVIFLPANVRPDEVITIAGLRPGEPLLEEDFGPISEIRALGGDYARTDPDGQFRLEVATAGPYHSLVLSRHAPVTGVPLPRKDLATLGRYFRPADELIDGIAYLWDSHKITKSQELSFRLR